MTEQLLLPVDPATPDVLFERDGDWYVARPAKLKTTGYVITTAVASKISFEDAGRILRRTLALS